MTEQTANTVESPMVRVHRVHLGISNVLVHSDVVERQDGTVWIAARRRKGRETLDGLSTEWTRVYRTFTETVRDLRWSERNYLTGEQTVIGEPVGGVSLAKFVGTER